VLKAAAAAVPAKNVRRDNDADSNFMNPASEIVAAGITTNN